MKRRRVVFVTSVFKEVAVGPAVYAQYLWRHFRDHPSIEFHLVAPSMSERHPRLHASSPASGSLGIYRALQEKAAEVCARLGAETVVHGNAAHSMYRFVRYPGTLIVQINDYEVADVLSAAGYYLQCGQLRQLASRLWRRQMERAVIRRADLVLCNSAFTRDAVMRAYGAESSRCRVLYKAVAVDDFFRPSLVPPDPWPWRQPGARLVFVGSNWRIKGLDLLLAALPSLAARHPTVSLLIAGPSAADPELRALVARHAPRGNVQILGHVAHEGLRELLWHADVAVLPSRREALGVALLEAMAAGLPVVATRVGGIPEIVDCDAAGVLVPPDSPDELARGISALLDDHERRRAIAAHGPRRAAEFSLPAMLHRLEKLYVEARA